MHIYTVLQIILTPCILSLNMIPIIYNSNEIVELDDIN